jgi:hypothetical protein
MREYGLWENMVDRGNVVGRKEYGVEKWEFVSVGGMMNRRREGEEVGTVEGEILKGNFLSIYFLTRPASSRRNGVNLN